MKAVIYARYSSHAQREESIEGQLRVCYDYARREGIGVIKEYIDRAMTATNDQRPSFQQMIAESSTTPALPEHRRISRQSRQDHSRSIRLLISRGGFVRLFFMYAKRPGTKPRPFHVYQ